MEKNSRTKKSIINSIYALMSKMATVVFSFAVRTVFIKVLTAEYLGLNGLFSNIITMLSLADLGIGIAIPYTLYKPLAENDKERIKILMNLYSKIFNVIGIIVLMVGISLTPFLSYLVKEMPDIKNINIIYILFVVNSACSYFFIYKRLLIDSDQKGYIANRINIITVIAFSLMQIVVLILTKHYILYLILTIFSTVLQNIFISIKCDKMYPYIKEKSNEKVSKNDIKELMKNTSALVIYRVGAVVMNGTDNLIISKMIGVIAVGIYSNYLLIINSLTTIISQIFNAITYSIGNMVVTDDNKKSEDMLNKLQFLNFWIYTVISTCLFLLINSFINLWIGNSYVLSVEVAFTIALNFYIYGMQGVVSAYRNAYGLFVQGKYRPIIMVVVNIIISILLAKYIGILGIIIGTVVSRLIIIGIYDPIVVYKHGFKTSVKKYFTNYTKYLMMFVTISLFGWIVLNKINISNILIWIIVGVGAFIGVNIILFITYRKTEEFKYYVHKFRNLIPKAKFN